MECVRQQRRGSGVMECWVEGGRRVMSVCSQCKWHLSSSDRLSLSPCNGDPVREPFPSIYPPSAHTLCHHSHVSLSHTLCNNFSSIFIFFYLPRYVHKLATFLCISIPPILCIIFNQSAPRSETADCQAVYAGLQLREREEKRRKNSKREIRKEGEGGYQYSHCRWDPHNDFLLSSCLNLTAKILHS